tara:strand:+ start:734 stop:916 length:183 start_codon:yes stop_codon:yes gene_type:complete
MEVTKEKLKKLLSDNSLEKLELTDDQKYRYNSYKNNVGGALAKAEALQEKLDGLLSSINN